MGWEDAPIVELAPKKEAWENAPIVSESKAPLFRGTRLLSQEQQQALQSQFSTEFKQRLGQPKKAESFEEFVMAGWQRTSLGMNARKTLPDVEVGQDAAWYDRATANTVDMLASLPVFIAGGVAGGIAFGAAGSTVAPGPGTIIGGVAGTAGGAFMADSMIRTAYVDALTKGEIQGPGDFTQRFMNIAWESFKGFTTGAATATAGAATAANFAAPAAKAVAATAAEVATMTTVGSMLNGHLPTWEEAMDSAIVIGGMKAALPTTKKILNVWARTGVRPEEVVAHSKLDPTIVEDLKATPPKDVVNGIEVTETSMAEFQKAQRTELIAGVPDSVFSSLPHMKAAESGLIHIDGFSSKEQIALRKAGLVEKGELKSGETHEGVNPEKLWGERQKRSDEARKAKEKTPETSRGEDEAFNEAAEHRAKNYEERAKNEESRGELADLDYIKQLKENARLARAGKRKLETQKPVRAEDPTTNIQEAKDTAKATVVTELQAGNITPEHAFRGGYIAELREIAKTGQLSIRSNSEGEAVISAAPVGDGKFTVYGAGSGYIVPPEITSKSGLAGEVHVDPRADPKTLKYVVNGKVMDFDAMSEAVLGPKETRVKSTEAKDAEAWMNNFLNGGSEHGNPIPRAYRDLASKDEAAHAFTGEKAIEVLDAPYTNIPEAKLPYQINLKYISGPTAIKELMTRMSEVYRSVIARQRGGTQSWAETEAKAAAKLKDLTDADVAKMVTGREPGTSANAVELQIRGDMLMQAATDASTLTKTYNDAKAAGVATDAMKFDAMEALSRMAMIQAEFTGAASEVGRALQYMQKIKEVREKGERIKELVDMYGNSPDVILKMAGMIDTPAGMVKFARKINKATYWDMYIEFYKAGLIGPVSQVANVIGNLSFALTHDVVDVVASLRPGGDVKLIEPYARMVGQAQGMYEGLKIALEFVRDEWKQPMEALRKLDEKSIPTKMEQHQKAIPGDLGVLVRSLSFPWLSAADGAFRLMAERGELNAWAARTATNEGLNPFTKEFRTRMAELAAEPPAEISKQIQEYGTRATFQGELGPFGKSLQSTLKISKVGQVFVPFLKTPSEVFKELARLGPTAPLVEAWRNDFKAGGAARDKAVTEIVVGGAIMGISMALAAQGKMTGSGPPEPDKRSVWLLTNQPYSLKVGDTWYDYARIQPIGTLIGLASDLQDLRKHMTPEEADRASKMVTIAFYNAVTNQVWLRGMVDMAKGVSEAERYGPKITQNIIANSIPATGWLGQTASLMDDHVREINSIYDAVRNKIPGVREGLIAKRDVFGESMENPERFLGVSPIRMKESGKDPIHTEAVRLGVGVAKTPKTINMPSGGDRKLGEVQLTPEQKDMFADVSGHLAYDILSPIVNSPSWKDRVDMDKKRIYEIVFEKSRAVARSKVLSDEQRQFETYRITSEIMKRRNE